MKEGILTPAMDKLRPELGKVVSMLETKVPYGAVSLSTRDVTQYNVDNNQEQVNTGEPKAGVIIRAFDGQMMRERSLGGFNIDKVLEETKDFTQAFDFSKNGKIDPGEERVENYQTAMEHDPALISTQEKLEYLRDLNQRVNKIDDRIVNARIGFVEFREKVVFRNRAEDLAQDVQRVRLSVMVTVMGEKGVVYDSISKCGTAGLEILSFTDDELDKVVMTAIKLLDAGRIEPGEYSIVTGPGVSGVICHESFGHGVETDMFLKERAKAAHFIDKRIGSDLVNIYDDPSYEGGFGSYFFDDEGYLAKPTQIVENGIFKRGITDQYSAHLLDIERSPNGRRQDFTRKVYPRMTNTFFGSGTTPVKDLIGQVEEGIYIPKFSSGMEDPKGWGIQVTGHYGFEIKGGKVTERMYSPVGITGYVPEVLSSITAVGDDFELACGYCGKGSKETVPVTSGGPHLLMKARLG
jgi:TldD protein